MTATDFLPLAWPIAETHLPERRERPVLSIIIPTYNRTVEMVQAVESIYEQINGDLALKAEVIISDNASGPEHQEAIRNLAGRFPGLCYYFNAINGDAELQWLTAPHRARGEWMWLFGDDDLLATGGVEYVVRRLEAERPYFLTLNRCVVDNELKRVLSTSKHNAPSASFPTIIDLSVYIGIDQLSFITSQVYHTDTAKSVDVNAYHLRRSGYAQIAYYVEAFADLHSAYEAEVFVIHRWHPEDHLKHSIQFRHLSTYLPRDFAFVRERTGMPRDLMERLGGVKSADIRRQDRVTFVDYVLHYLFAAITTGPIDPNEWEFLETEAANWRPDRLAAIQKAHQLYDELAKHRHEVLVRNGELQLIQEKAGMPDALKRLATATHSHELSLLNERIMVLSREALAISETYI